MIAISIMYLYHVFVYTKMLVSISSCLTSMIKFLLQPRFIGLEVGLNSVT